MTPAQFRKFALAHEGAVEQQHMNHPDFRHPNGRIYATLDEDETRAMVKVWPELQATAIERDPEVYEAAAGAWGKAGCTYVHLKKASAPFVKMLLREAWTMASEAKPTRAKKPSAAAKSKRAKR